MLRACIWRALVPALAISAIGTGLLLCDGLNDELGSADVGLVLGNTVHPDGTPSRRLAARLERALDLYRQGVFPLIIVSGARGGEGHDEAVVMRGYLVGRGVPPEHVLVDSAGVTTYASARNVQKLLHERHLRSVLLISQYFHVPRAKLALKRFGVSPVYSAHARFFEARDLYSIPRELVGYLHYSLRSYELSPAPPP
jgi:vancomycin permeability regulator SanA